MTKSTKQFENQIESAKNREEFKQILREIGNITFGMRFGELLEKYHMTIHQLSLESAVSSSMLHAINNGTRHPSKKQVIKIGLTLGTTKEELNELLKLSNNKELYSKNKEDAIVLFGLKEGLNIYEISELLKEEECYEKLQLLDE